MVMKEGEIIDLRSHHTSPVGPRARSPRMMRASLAAFLGVLLGGLARGPTFSPPTYSRRSFHGCRSEPS